MSRTKIDVTRTDLHPKVFRENQIRFGLWLRDRRESLGLSQRAAAKKGSCSDAWLCQLETADCDCTAIQVNSLPKLAIAYQLNVITILEAILGVSGCKWER
jgi:transcriptional regulator with XRE-family HTH domain